MSAIWGIGVDIADVARFSRLLAVHGARFAEKWFTPSELEDALRAPHPARLLAERFAVKEAVWKALGPAEWSTPLPWRGISTEAALTSGELSVTSIGRLGEQIASDIRIRASASSTSKLATAVAVVSYS